MTSKNKGLVICSDMQMCDQFRIYLEREGYSLIFSHDGINALNLFSVEAPYFVIIDKELSKSDSVFILREITKISNLPIIMLGRRNDTIDRILCLEMGCDDVIEIPFDFRELVARLKAIIRRYDGREKNNVSAVVYNGISVNITNYELYLDGEKIHIPPKELELLYFLASNPNVVFTREQILDRIWGFDYFGDFRTVDVHIKRLREKLKEHEKGWSLKTVWGIGYKFAIT